MERREVGTQDLSWRFEKTRPNRPRRRWHSETRKGKRRCSSSSWAISFSRWKSRRATKGYEQEQGKGEFKKKKKKKEKERKINKTRNKPLWSGLPKGKSTWKIQRRHWTKAARWSRCWRLLRSKSWWHSMSRQRKRRKWSTTRTERKKKGKEKEEEEEIIWRAHQSTNKPKGLSCKRWREIREI